MDEILKIALPAFIGLIAGAIGSLIAPWINWGIEIRRLRLQARREMIAAARSELQAGLDKEEFRESSIYSQLRPFLSERISQDIESDSVVVQSEGRGRGVNNYIPDVLDVLNNLEEKWKLL